MLIQIRIDADGVDDRENRVEIKDAVGRDKLKCHHRVFELFKVQSLGVFLGRICNAEGQREREDDRGEHRCEDRENQQRARAVAQIPLEYREAFAQPVSKG